MGGLSVALRKESVDRNTLTTTICIALKRSLSARRAWIEIDAPSSAPYAALSLSARRAWIEMVYLALIRYLINVALRKESVDRNGSADYVEYNYNSRSPQGERG